MSVLLTNSIGIPLSQKETARESWRDMGKRAVRLAPRTSTWLLEVLRDSPFGLAIYNRQLRFVAVNPAVAAMDRVPVEDHVGRETSEIAGATSKIMEPRVERVFRTGKPLNGFELSAQLPTRGDVAHWIQDFIPIPDERDRVVEVAVIAKEITEQRQLEATIRKLRKAARAGGTITDPRGLSARANSATSHSTLVSRELPGTVLVPPSAETPSDVLSPRELQVFRFLAQGKSNKQVAAQLEISEKTVETYRSRITLKLGLSSLVELTHCAIRHGIVEP